MLWRCGCVECVMARLSKAHLSRLESYLKNDDRSEPSLRDVMALAELTTESLQSFYSRFDREVYGELVGISEYILTMRREIASLGVTDLKETRLPSAGIELDEIVRSTEEATNTIMTCAEDLFTLGPDSDNLSDKIGDAATRIMEACAFQDLTGQRIAKVVETLKAIESRVSRFAAAVGSTEGKTELDANEEARAKRKHDLLLNGPQSKSDAVKQTDVDAMMAGGSDQDAIDRLFG